MLQTKVKLTHVLQLMHDTIVDMPAGVKGVESDVTELHYLKPVCLDEMDPILKK